MIYEMPITYFEDNLIFNKDSKECWACFQITGVSYEFLSKDKKILLLNKISRFIANIGDTAQILIIPVSQDIHTHFDKMIKSLDTTDTLYETAKAHALGTEAYLKERLRVEGDSNDCIIYVLTKIKRQWNLNEAFRNMMKRPVKTIKNYLAIEQNEILEADIEDFNAVMDTYYNGQNKRMRLTKTTAQTTQWLIKRMFRRGVPGEVPLRTQHDGAEWKPGFETIIRDGQAFRRPYNVDTLTLTEAEVIPQKRYVEIKNSDDTVSYQTFLTIASIPDGLAFPGGEWLLMLQDYPITTEVCIHLSMREHREALKQLDGKKMEIASQVEHVAANDKVPDELWNASRSAEQLENELKRSRDPLCTMLVSICIASDNLDDMEKKAKFVRERYEDVNFEVQRPMTDQFKLFMTSMPGAGKYLTDYNLRLPPKTIAGSMFAATRQLGDNRGPYVGTTGILNKKVFLWLEIACQMNRSASAAFLGTLGGGKSFNANLLLYLSVIYGAKGLIIDPKGERSNWIKDLPSLQGHISITTLSPGPEDQGKLDPFIVYRGYPDEAVELTLNVLCEYFGFTSRDDEYDALTETLEKVKHIDAPCMSKLVEELNNFPASDELHTVAKRLARKIESLKNIGMGRLLFGTGEELGLNFNQKINILQIQNLTMPDPETPKEDYSQEERLSTVLMIPIASFCMRFARSDRSIFKLVLMDESWALNRTQAGSKLYNNLARLGRSLNAGTIFIGHSVTDLNSEGIKEAITYKFCFKANTVDEIQRVLEFLDLEVTDDNIELVRNLANGQCLFQDLDGRVGVLKFDAVWQELIDAFDTTPDSKKKVV